MEFHERLKTVRKRTGVTTKAISDLSGIHYSQMKMYSSGSRKPKLENMEKIASIEPFQKYREFLLGLSVDSGQDTDPFELSGHQDWLLLIDDIRSEDIESESIEALKLLLSVRRNSRK